MTTPADLSYAHALYADEVSRQKAIVKARMYHDGRQPIALTDRLREFLGLGNNARSSTTGGIWSDQDDHANPFVLNVSRIVVNAVTERMLIAGFDTDEPAQDDARQALPRPVADWAWVTWQASRMDAKQDDTHTGTVRDGESFVLVDWDSDNARSRFTPHPAYTDAQECGGDGFGCKVFYPDDDPNLPPAFATKRWTASAIDGNGKRTTSQRLHIYYPDRIERQTLIGGVWAPYDRPIPWVDRMGRPLGVAVVPFRNVGCRAEAWDALPLQDALNKSLIDLITAADVTAFRILAAFGWVPTSDGLAPAIDGSNALFVQPGMIIGTTKSKADADLKAIEGANLDQLVNVISNLILWIAMVTDTPLSRFTQTRQIAAEGTLQQQESVLLGKIRKRQALLGNGWEDCLNLARRLENTFGAGGLAEDVQLSARWERAETRDEKADRETLLIEQQLGVPQEVIWAKLGYSPGEIDAMRQAKAEQAQRALEAQQQLLAAQAPRPQTTVKNVRRGPDGRIAQVTEEMMHGH